MRIGTKSILIGAHQFLLQQKRTVREGVYAEIAARHQWPPPDEWDGQPFAIRPPNAA